jgi:phosphoribosyl 1,2-cyclic phosphodiesterase
VSHEGEYILIDAGVSYRGMTQALGALGITPRELSAVLITHAHSDHIGGLTTLTKRVSTEIIASAEACDGVQRHTCEERRVSPIEPDREFAVGSFTVRAFRTSHDSPGSVGYRISAAGRTLSYCTDLGIVTQTVLDAVRECDTAVLESNHDVTMLRRGQYPATLKRRILGDYGHLSNDACSRLAVTLAQSGTRRVILAHISRENNTPTLALDTNVHALQLAGATVGDGGDIDVTDAPQYGMSRTYTV